MGRFWRGRHGSVAGARGKVLRRMLVVVMVAAVGGAALAVVVGLQGHPSPLRSATHPGSVRPLGAAATADPPCSDGQLSAVLPSEDATTASLAGTASVIEIELQNTATMGCTVTGWPLVVGVDPASGSADSTVSNLTDAAYGSMASMSIDIAAGGSATFFLSFGYPQSGGSICEGHEVLEVTPPGSSTSTEQSLTIPEDGLGPCLGQWIDVSPVVPSDVPMFSTYPGPVSSLASPTRPPLCTVSSLATVGISTNSSGRGPSLIVRIRNRSSRTCAVPSRWPLVTLRASGGVTIFGRLGTSQPSGVVGSGPVSSAAFAVMAPGQEAGFAIQMPPMAGGSPTCGPLTSVGFNLPALPGSGPVLGPDKFVVAAPHSVSACSGQRPLVSPLYALS